MNRVSSWQKSTAVIGVTRYFIVSGINSIVISSAK
jgi:hypothetical protein